MVHELQDQLSFLLSPSCLVPLSACFLLSHLLSDLQQNQLLLLFVLPLETRGPLTDVLRKLFLVLSVLLQPFWSLVLQHVSGSPTVQAGMSVSEDKISLQIHCLPEEVSD